MPNRKMVTYQLIQDLVKENKLNLFLRKGLISLSVIDYKNIYEYYNVQIKDLRSEKNGRVKTQAIENTCIKFECDENKVYRAIKRMES